jgi:hypothetical protein
MAGLMSPRITNKNMKNSLKAFCLVLISSVVATGNCAEPYRYRVHGEVHYEEGQNISSRSIPSDVVSGVPIILKGGAKTISLLFNIEPPPSVKYSLTVSLLTNPKSVDGFSSTLLTNTFQSNLVGGNHGPLEFKMEQNGIKMEGVIGISLKH